MAGPLDHAHVTEPKNPEMTPEQEPKKTRIRLKKNSKMVDQARKNIGKRVREYFVRKTRKRGQKDAIKSVASIVFTPWEL